MNARALGRKFVFSGLAVGALMFAGCMTDNEASSNAKVNIADLKVTPSSIKAGQTADVEGTVTSDNGLTSVKISIWKGASNVSAGMGFEVVDPALVGTLMALSLKTDGKAKITVGPLAATGDYTVKVIARSGTDSVTASTDLKVTGTAVTTENLTLGANANVLGGSVDLDELKVYTHADAKAVSGKIDLYYAHSKTEGDKLFTPLQAKNSGFGTTSNGPATWTVANATDFNKVLLSESAFAAISTQESIDALWATGTKVTGGGDNVVEGATYVVNTDMAKKVLIRVTAYVAGEAGTITVKGTK